MVLGVVLAAALQAAAAQSPPPLPAGPTAVPPSTLAEGLGPVGPLTAASAVPDPQSLAAAHGRAQTIIEKAHASDLFEDVTKGPVVALRHRQSGFVCGFSDDPKNNVMLFGAKRGEDVSCNSYRGEELDTLYFTKLSPGMTVQQAMGAVMQDVRNNHADLAAAKGPFGTGSSRDPAVPPHLSARFVFGKGGITYFGRVSVAVVDGWMIQQRISAPLADQVAVDTRTEMDFTVELQLLRKFLPAPTPIQP